MTTDKLQIAPNMIGASLRRPLLLIIATVSVFFFVGKAITSMRTNAAPVVAGRERFPFAGDDLPFEGPADAPVTLVVFCRLNCPYCRAFRTVIDRVLADNSGRVRVSFLLSNRIWEDAQDRVAAAAALAAQDQGLFWTRYDRFFASPLPSNPSALARELGLDPARFDSFRKSEKANRQFRAQMKLPALLAIRATPTVFVNGRRFGGAPSSNDLNRTIRDEIQVVDAAQRGGVGRR
jgi:protein-disulfide isomerase